MAEQVVQSNQRQQALPATTVYMKKVSGALHAILEKKEKALPGSLNRERFELNTIQMLQDAMKTEKSAQRWMECDPTTAAMTLAKAALLDLDFFNGECYAIPYGKNIQFQTDYKGEVKLVKKYSKNPIKDVYAKVVRQGDQFDVDIEDGVQHLRFRPDPFSDADIIGAFAVIYYKDGSMIFDTMSKKEIDDVRNAYSKDKQSKAWENSYGEMCKKTVLRRICKMVDMDFNAEQIRAFNDGGDAEFDNTSSHQQETVQRQSVDIFANDKKMQAQIAKKNHKQIEISQTQQEVVQEQPQEAQPVQQAPQQAEVVDFDQVADAEFAQFEAEYANSVPQQTELPFK